MKKQHGFSLVELLISVSIIAILIAIGIASYSTINKQSRDTKRKSDIEQLRSAIEMYRSENGYYPNTGAGWVDITSLSALTPTYIPAIPEDPKNTTPYVYRYKATGLSNGQYYGYCIEATVESAGSLSNTCTSIESGFNYGVKNP